jgi:hypothetical protein
MFGAVISNKKTGGRKMHTLTFVPVRHNELELKAIALPINQNIHKFTCYIERSDWDEKLLKYEKSASRVCIAVVVAAMLYFLPTVVSVFLR